MKFIDEVTIEVSSGDGGNGVTRFRREKFVSKGGPDGGDGGKGGDIIFEGDEGENTLLHFRGVKKYKAQDGEKGDGGQRNGSNGEDLILKVPTGTMIKDAETGEILADITEHKQQVNLLKGGRGGHGNAFYKSSTNQVPLYSQDGKPGESLSITLELKLLADIALIGLPNAGKSTLISVLSAARPKIADYPFTTLVPNLGVVQVGDKSFVVADVPGLIEKASEGKGLGIRFLKHIERTRSLVHLIDCSMLLDEFEVMEHYSVIKNELLNYDPSFSGKREIVCLTKTDAMSEEEITRFRESLEKSLDKKVLDISSVSGKNIELLKDLMLKTLEAGE